MNNKNKPLPDFIPLSTSPENNNPPISKTTSTTLTTTTPTTILGKRKIYYNTSPSIWYKYLDNDIAVINESDIITHGITNAKSLLGYIKAGIKDPLPALEVTYRDIVLFPDAKLKNLITNENFPIRIVYKHIKYLDNIPRIPKKFFKQRGISFDFGVIGKKSLDPFMEKIKDENFQIDENRVEFVQRDYKITILDSENVVQALIFQFLMAGLTEEEGQYIQFKYRYEIETDSLEIHRANPDYVLFNVKAERVLIVCAGRCYDIEQALLYNFEQMRSFSMSADGKNLKYIYGLSSVGTKWIFCCYVVPMNRKNVSESNFMTSRVMVNDMVDGTIGKNFLDMMIRYIRGVLVKDIDAILDIEVMKSVFRL